MQENQKCNKETEIYSRVSGYHRPVKNWNVGKQEEFKERKPFQFKVEFSKDGKPEIKKI